MSELKAFKVVYVAGNRLESIWIRDIPWRVTYQPGRWSESPAPVLVVKTREQAESYMRFLWRSVGLLIDEYQLWEVEVDEFVELPYGPKVLGVEHVAEQGERFWAGEMADNWLLYVIPPGGTIGAASAKPIRQITWAPPRPG